MLIGSDGQGFDAECGCTVRIIRVKLDECLLIGEVYLVEGPLVEHLVDPPRK